MFLKNFFFFFFLLMENLGAMAYSRYTGFREITDRDVLELHCTHIVGRNRTENNIKPKFSLSAKLSKFRQSAVSRS